MSTELTPDQIAAEMSKQQSQELLEKVRNDYSLQVGDLLVRALNLPFPITPPGKEHTAQGMRVLRRLLVSTGMSNGYTLNEMIYHLKKQWIGEADHRRKKARENKARRAEAKEIGVKRGIPLEVIEESLLAQFGPEAKPEEQARDEELEKADKVLAEAVAEEGKTLEPTKLELLGPNGSPLN